MKCSGSGSIYYILVIKSSNIYFDYDYDYDYEYHYYHETTTTTTTTTTLLLLLLLIIIITILLLVLPRGGCSPTNALTAVYYYKKSSRF